MLPSREVPTLEVMLGSLGSPLLFDIGGGIENPCNMTPRPSPMHPLLATQAPHVSRPRVARHSWGLVPSGGVRRVMMVGRRGKEGVGESSVGGRMATAAMRVLEIDSGQ